MDKRRLLRIRNTVKELFQATGTPIDDVALDFGLKMAQDAQFQKLVNRPGQIAVVSVVAGFLHEVSTQPDLPEEQFERLLQEMKKMTFGLRPQLRDGMRAVVKGLPKKPSSGRNKIFDSLQKRIEACDLISKYERLGHSKREAYDRVGGEMNCSARTVQRVWRARGRSSSTSKKAPRS
jgi:hypothetical protein